MIEVQFSGINSVIHAFCTPSLDEYGVQIGFLARQGLLDYRRTSFVET